jgi:hypothetical protein
MRERRAKHIPIGLPRQTEIVGIASVAPQQARVFGTRHGLAYGVFSDWRIIDIGQCAPLTFVDGRRIASEMAAFLNYDNFSAAPQLPERR